MALLAPNALQLLVLVLVAQPLEVVAIHGQAAGMRRHAAHNELNAMFEEAPHECRVRGRQLRVAARRGREHVGRPNHARRY